MTRAHRSPWRLLRGPLAILMLATMPLPVMPTAQPVGTTEVPSRDQADGDGAIHPQDEPYSVELVSSGTYFYKGTDGGQRRTGSAGSHIAVGETGSATIAVGFFDEAGRDMGHLCSNCTGCPPDVDAPHVWTATYTVLPAEAGRVSLDVTWKRTHAERRGQPVEVAGDTRRIVMEAGATHVLDWVGLTPDAEDYCYRNLSVGITADVAADPELMYELLNYDLWLRHTSDRGHVQTHRFQTIGNHGDRVKFRFLPLRFPVEDPLADGTRFESILELSGTVQGRLRGDGTIELLLDAARWIGMDRTGKPRRGGIGDGGSKRFTVTPGETVSMLLPAPRGATRIETWTAASGTSPRSSSEWVTVDNAQFYAGHQDEIVVTVTRVR